MVFLLISFMVYILCLGNKKDGFEMLNKTVIIVTTLIYGLVEGLGAVDQLTTQSIRSFWYGLLVILSVLFITYFVKHGNFHIVEKLQWFNGIYILTILIFLVALCIFTAHIVPNNFDSMTYHLPRIMHWLQNQNTSYYATNIDRQNFSPVLGEYIFLNIYALSSKDVYLQFSQVFSYILGGIISAGITKELGACKKGMILSTVIFYASPMMLAEAFTTQVDNIATLYLLISLYYIILLMKNELFHVERLVGCTLGIAFSYLSKPTVCIAIFLFLVGLLFYKMMQKEKVQRVVASFFVALPVLVITISPVILRNVKLYGNMLAGNQFSNIAVGTIKPRYLVVNILKNLFSNLFSEVTWINNLFIQFVYACGKVLKVNVEDASISWNYKFGEYIKVYHHDYGSNWIIMILLLIAIVFFCKRKEGKSVVDKIYCLCSLVSLLSICALLKYQPWGNRIMLPFVMLLCPFIGRVFSIYGNILLKKICLIPIIFMCLLVVVQNFRYNSQYLYGKETDYYAGYFANNMPKFEIYRDITSLISREGFENIGLCTHGDSYEYPLWAGIENPAKITIKHIWVRSDELKRLEDSNWNPDCIITIQRDEFVNLNEIEYNGKNYELLWEYASGSAYKVYKKR